MSERSSTSEPVYRDLVQAGQVYETTDKRDAGRRIRVEKVHATQADVVTVVPAPGRPNGVGKTSSVAIRRVSAKATLPGWRLVQLADGTEVSS